MRTLLEALSKAEEFSSFRLRAGEKSVCLSRTTRQFLRGRADPIVSFVAGTRKSQQGEQFGASSSLLITENVSFRSLFVSPSRKS
jgi:hypothetical protein